VRLRSSANDAHVSGYDASPADGAPLPAAANVDPMLVAAFSMDDPYVVAIRGIRSSIVQSYGDVSRDTRYCAVIGLDCDEPLAVMAANLGVVMIHMGASTLVVDANRAAPRVAGLYGVADAAQVQQTPIAGLWVAGTGSADGYSQEPVERRPLIEQRDEWNIRVDQVVAVMALNDANGAASIANAVAGFDAAVILARKNVTLVQRTRNLIEALDQHRVAIVGTVMV
jgi:Mrp family chromosome partitioning ATPase